MRRSTDRIITTHAGSLSRPSDLIALNRARAAGETWDDGAYQKCLSSAVADVIRKQQELGVDVPDDGEFGKPMAANYDYGVWWNYAFARMEGFVAADSVAESAHKKSSVADVALTTIGNRRDWQKFSEFYQDPESSGTLVGSAARRPTRRPVCTAPIKYVGHAAIRADIENLKKAMASSGIEEGFMCSIAPGSFAPTACLKAPRSRCSWCDGLGASAQRMPGDADAKRGSPSLTLPTWTDGASSS